MLLLWRLLFRRFFKVFGLTISSFIAFLLIFQLHDLANFAASGAALGNLILITALHIPYLLPLAIPLSTLLAAALLFIGLSRSHELTALRASGLSLAFILKPLFILGVFLSMTNFYCTSELATYAHLQSRQMIYKLTSSNPLFLLENNRLAAFKEGFVSVESVRQGEHSKNLILAKISPAAKRISLLLSKELLISKNRLIAKETTLLVPLSEENLYLENIALCESEMQDWMNFLRPVKWNLALDHLPYRLLTKEIARMKKIDPQNYAKRITKGYAEILRRFSFGLAPLTFMISGALFGIMVTRERSHNLILLSGLAFAMLISLFVAMQIDSRLEIAAALFVLPHALLLGAAALRLLKLEHIQLKTRTRGSYASH